MTTNLIIGFDLGGMPGFTIDDVSYAPAHGTIFECDWGHYIQDRGKLKELKKWMEDTNLIADVYMVMYGINSANVYINLVTREVFDKYVERHILKQK